MPLLAGSILRVPCPSIALLVGVLTLQQCCDTLVFHPALPSAFSLPSAQPQGFPDEAEVRGALLSGCERRQTAISLRGGSNSKEAWYTFFFLSPKEDKKNTLDISIVEFVTSTYEYVQTCRPIMLFF